MTDPIATSPLFPWPKLPDDLDWPPATPLPPQTERGTSGDHPHYDRHLPPLARAVSSDPASEG